MPGPGPITSVAADVVVPTASIDPSRGLSAADVQSRIDAGLVNAAPPKATRTIGQILRANVLTRFNAILGALLVVVAIVGPPQDALFGGVLLANTTIGVVQEIRAKRTLDRLSILTSPRAHVVRDGATREVEASLLVLDDVIELRRGDQVATDGIVVRAELLEVDESLVSGEAKPVVKVAGDAVLSGSFVVSGTGRVRVTAVGSATYAAELEARARRFSLIRSELQQGTNTILRAVTWVMVPAGIGLVLSQLFRSHQTTEEALRASVAGVSAMVPEGLVLLTSVAFAVGALRLARRRVLVQELAAVEGLARVDVLCIDKTGTLTAPGMHVASTTVFGTHTRAQVDEVLEALVAADPAPNATLRALHRDGCHDPGWTVVGRMPFSSARRWSATSFKDHGTWVLGAPEALTGAADESVAAALLSMRRSAQRVLVLATAPVRLEPPALPQPLAPAAIVALTEKLRPDAAETIQYLSGQNVTVKVLSGDAPDTVAHVAAAVGIGRSEVARDASLMPDDAALSQALVETDVLGRVSPEQKLAAVRSLQAQGHVVAMVGDGVNDVQALKQADLGIGLGSGSEASRAVSRVVLLDDAFSAVPAILAEGRRVIANIERVANLFVTKTVYAALLAAIVAVTAVPFPFFPRQLTIVSTFTIGIPGFFLALARRAPRATSGFTRRVVGFTVPAGIAGAAATFSAYAVARAWTSTAAQSRTAAMLALLAFGLWILLVIARPLSASTVLLVVAMGLGALLPLLSAQGRRVFGLALPDVPVLVGIAGVVTIAVALHVVLQRWPPTRLRWTGDSEDGGTATPRSFGPG